MSTAFTSRVRPYTLLPSISTPLRHVATYTSHPRFFHPPERFTPILCTSEESTVLPADDMSVDAGTPLDEEDKKPEGEIIDLHPSGMNETNQHRISRYQAKKEASRVIAEQQRPLSEYMTLPVSQYSVLDAEKVERLDENTFKVVTSTINFFGIKMTPVMKVSVEPHDTGCEVHLLDCTLEGSRVASNVDERFACFMRNYVSYTKEEETGEVKLTGDCVVQIAGIVPRWLNAIVSINTVNGLGRRLMKKILDVAMPRFLQQLEKDYTNWASGDDSRQAMSTGDAFGLDDASLKTSVKEE